MIDIGSVEYWLDPVEATPPPKPNLCTGEGHGHYRAWTREKLMKGAYKHKHRKMKMAKKSKRRNRG